MKSYKKYLEYMMVHDAQIYPWCDPKNVYYITSYDEYIATMRYFKNSRKPNRVRNVEYTLDCWVRHKQKKKKKKS